MQLLIPEIQAEIRSAGQFIPQWSLCTAESTQANTIRVQGKNLINFASDDYLNFSRDERLKRLALESIQSSGLGVSTSPRCGGNRPSSEICARTICSFLGCSAAVLFQSRLHALGAMFSTLLRRDDLVFVEQLSYPSIGDVVRATGAQLIYFSAAEPDYLDALLRQYSATSHRGSVRRFVMVEGVSLLTGVAHPLGKIFELVTKNGAHLIVEESTAFGVSGLGGRGAMSAAGIPGGSSSLILSFDQALGSFGAALCSSAEICELVKLSAHQYAFEAALPEVFPVIASRAIELLEGETLRRAKIQDLSSRVRSTLSLMGYSIYGGANTASTVAPVIGVRLSDRALGARLADGLFERGIFVSPSFIVPGATPAGGGTCVRVVVHSQHTDTDLASLLQGFEEVGKRLSILGKP